MNLSYRYAELLSSDAKKRLAVYGRADQRFQLVEERVESYESGDEYNPEHVPFPTDANWQPHWIIQTRPLDGLFGTVDAAVREATRRLADGS